MQFVCDVQITQPASGVSSISVRQIAVALLLYGFCTCGAAQANIFDPNLWFGDNALSKGDYAKAREHYIKAQVSDPKNPRLSYNLGVCSYRAAFADDANAPIQAGAGTYTSTNAPAEISVDAEKLKEAAQLFSVAASKSKSTKLSNKALYNLGNALAYLGKLKEAIAAYEKALAVNPQDEDAKYNLERTKIKLKEMEEKCPKNDKNQKQQEEQKKQEQEQQRQDMDRLMQGVDDAPTPQAQAAKPKPPPDPEHWW